MDRAIARWADTLCPLIVRFISNQRTKVKNKMRTFCALTFYAQSVFQRGRSKIRRTMGSK
jgi:hypothetical protein